MKFGLLGPLEVSTGERIFRLGGTKQRSLLALLLLARGQPLSTDRLIDELWDGRPPATAHKSVQAYVSGLRKELGDERIATVERGYALRIEHGELDVERFEQLVRSASEASPTEALGKLQEALALVRGEPLSDLRAHTWAGQEAERLDELVLEALEARLEAELALGHHRRAVRELETLLGEHPYRERLAELVMLALYRSGRQADALAAYRQYASRLRVELGLEPGRAIQQLEQAILNQDPALDSEQAKPEPPTTAIARWRSGWRLLVAGGALLVAAATVALIVVLARSDKASLETLDPGGVILEARSGEVVATVPRENLIDVSLATDAGRFWVSASDFFAIEPSTGKIVRRLTLPLGEPNGALPLGRSIWFTTHHDLIRVDAGVGHLGREVDRFRLLNATHPHGLVGIASGAGSLWIASNEEGEVLRVNPATGMIQGRVAMRFPWAVAYGDGAVWVATNEDGVRRIDPATNTVTAVATVPGPLSSIAVGGGFAWTANETKGTVYKVDRSGNVVGTFRTGDGAHDVSYAAGTLWVANQDAGTLTGIDAATGAERSYRFGHPVGTVAALGGHVLVVLAEGLTSEDRIAAMTGEVAKLVVPIYQFDPPDPALAWNPFVFQVERATCAGLLNYADTHPPAGRRLRPELAASMPIVSRDGRTYRFTVREGYRFAPPSNVPVTPAAIRFSIERALSPKLGDFRPGALFMGDLVGATDYIQGRRRAISGIRVHGSTISFTLARPSADFLERLSLPFFCTVPIGTPAVNGGVQPIAPPTAGPYYMAARENGEWMILRRNPNYRGPRPHALDAIAFREGLDAEQAVARVADGALDGLALDDPLLRPGSAVARRFDESGPNGTTYRALPQASIGYLALNSGGGPLRDGALRRAVAAALDRVALATYWDSSPTTRLLPPGVRNGAVTRPVRRNPIPARTLVRRKAITLTMAIHRGCGDRCARFAELIASTLRPVGISLRARSVDDPYAAMHAGTADVDLVDFETGLPYPDPATFLERMLGGDVPPDWLPISTRVSVARLGELRGAERDRAAAALAARLERTDVPVIVYGTRTVGTLLGPRLGCRIWNSVDAGLDLAALCLRSKG